MLEGFIVAGALHHFGLRDEHDGPTLHKPPVIFPAYTLQGQFKWMCQQARTIRNHLTLVETDDISNNIDVPMENINAQEQWLQTTMGNDGKYHCPYCQTTYVSKAWMKKHLRLKHHVMIHSFADDIPIMDANADPTVPTLIKVLFLQFDTSNAYHFGDGDWAMRNAKFEFLYLWVMKHTKYRLWIWRMLAYDMALLSEKESMEYRWNQCVNTHGGVGRCIPNDNFVETQVKNILKNMARQGPNKSFATAQVACKTTQVVTAVKCGLKKASGQHDKSCKHSKPNTSNDVMDIARAIQQAGLIENPGQILEAFESFKEPLAKIKPIDLHKWIAAQKETADADMRFEEF